MHTLSLASYNIYIENEFNHLKKLFVDNKYSKYIVLVDENTEKYCLNIFLQNIDIKCFIIKIKSGEINKNLDTCTFIWQQLIEQNVDRNALIINLGGGVIGDMGGFAASCYKRGIDFAMVPTTLLSQVDSSIGGKLGIDFEYGKNIIGVFNNPKWVYINTSFLKTLDTRLLRNGFAEMFKHALIYDKLQWETLSAADNLDIELIESIIFDNLSVKKDVVEKDPYEKGLRKILNFGHTIGHAIEASVLQQSQSTMLHGEAVMLGMVLEAIISHQKLILPLEIVQSIFEVYNKWYLPYTDHLDVDTLMNYMLMDKKNTGTSINCVLLKDIGVPEIDQSINKNDVEKAINFYQKMLLHG
jgi:3-dehydroquinate synthase